MEDPAEAFAQYWAFARGDGVDRDVDRAMTALRASAEAGYAPAQAQLAGEIFGADKDEALRWYLAAAAQGDAEGQLGAGRMLYRGRFVPRDEARGLTLLAAAAAQGDEDAVREHAEAAQQMAAAALGEEAKLDAALREHGLEAARAAVLATARWSVRLVSRRAETDAALAVGASKLGGAPDVPAAFAWPMREGRRLAFVAQVALAEVQRAAAEVVRGLPAGGVLAFFYDADRQPWGSRDEESGWCVAYHPADLPLVRDRGEPAFAPCAIDMFAELTVPPVRSALARGLGDDVLAGYAQLHDRLTRIYRRAPRDDGDVHRIGGHPDAIQGDMTRRIEYGWRGADLDAPSDELEAASREWRLLLQIDSDARAGMMWGDLGRLYVWMREADLRAGRWAEARLQLQCS